MFTSIGSRIIFLIIKGLSWIPDFIWVIKARFLAFLIREVAAYRSEVVKENLLNSFPNKDTSERKSLGTRFYKHFAEVFCEMILLTRIRPKAGSSRISISNHEVLDDYLEQKKNLVILAGHYGNWEWNIPAILASGYRLFAVYKPQSSGLADQLMKRIRQKPGLTLLPMKETIRAILGETGNQGKPFVLLLIADQIPWWGDIQYWTQFLGQETAFFNGGEKIARRFGMPVLYIHQDKLSFGHYRASLEEIYDGVQPFSDNEVTERFVKCLETSVVANPHLWLWSHRRWKYRREDIHLH
jgi:KDO2-lipid IV(A) lauroyltransferase